MSDIASRPGPSGPPGPPGLEIRDAMPADEAGWRDLWAGFLAYYGVTLDPEVTDHTWARLMDPENRLSARLAFLDGRMAGFAIHHHHDSTWVKGCDCYLEDLYVAGHARRRGVARALIEDLIGIARARGWRRLYWNTDAANADARALYDRFTESDGHIRYRMPL
ncbi:GNAT family N-acetyltransferase [Aliigemmobacter aestuarii]|uniref:GNAT family N-acetyltransferase n=2 Tax=Aliigemmobacter aestuarii TaxID=1445661 RepID=A0A4S3MP24_9RHOB|nr:GNAT family N-acetyltransferase [Gemmobacter aestuarii]